MITKAIFPIAGLGTRFLPLSKAVPKELLPLVDKPAIEYLLKEAMAAGIKEIIFVTRPGEKEAVLNYLKKSPKLEKILKERKKEHFLDELKDLDEIIQNLSFHTVVQREPLGDGHAVLQAKRIIGGEDCAVLFSDDIIDARQPGLAQMLQVFKTCNKPIVAIKKVPKERLPFYGVVKVEKIAFRLYKIKNIVEKPPAESAPSDLAIVGRYIMTDEMLNYLKKTPSNEKGEIILADAMRSMIKDGKMIYGYEFDGDWVECGDKLLWMKSNLHFSLKHPVFGPELKKYLKEIK